MAFGRSTLIRGALAALLTGHIAAIRSYGQIALPAETTLTPPAGSLLVQGSGMQRLPPVIPPQDIEPAVVPQPARSFWQLPSREECGQWFKRADDSPGWQARPFSTSYSLGAMDGEHLVRGRLDQGTGFLFSKRYGWDFAEHWGLEARLSEAGLPVIDMTGQMRTHTGHVLMADANLLLYPWGDTRLRPFLTVGSGLVDFNFDDVDGRKNKLLVGLPAGIGCKYFWNEHLALRIDAQDNLALGGHGLSTTNNGSLTIGAEIRLGDLRSLWPWHKRQAP